MAETGVYYQVVAHGWGWPPHFRTQCEAIQWAEDKLPSGTRYTVEVAGTILASVTTRNQFPYCHCWRAGECATKKKVKKFSSFLRTVRLAEYVGNEFGRGDVKVAYKPGMYLYESILVKAADKSFIGVIVEFQGEGPASVAVLRRSVEVPNA